jgi:hypothetical protein
MLPRLLVLLLILGAFRMVLVHGLWLGLRRNTLVHFSIQVRYLQ